MNPWISIWCHPRETIRRIAIEGPKRSLWILGGIYGFSSLLNVFQTVSLGLSLSGLWILLLALVFSPFWGVALISAWSGIVHWVGKLFKGQGNYQAVRAAYLWSCVPFSLTALVWIILTVLFGRFLYMEMPETALSGFGVTILLVLLTIKMVALLWSLVIYVNTLAEVQKISILRAIGNILGAGILVGVILALLGMAILGWVH